MMKLLIGIAALAALSCLPVMPSQAKDAAAGEGLFQHCAKVRNDDTVRGYDPSLRAPTIKAFKMLFPDARGEPDPSSFATQAHYRCMGGKVMACFIGANLPCSKINTTKHNPGVIGFCKENPNAGLVPAVATGHDSAYAFKCRDGKPVVDGTTWTLDKRGFARKIWTVLTRH
ncbi:MAG: hypothetical protein ACTHN2_12585 [Nitrobacter sp.]